MALIKCPECGKEISDRAESCPNCGCLIDEEEVSDTSLTKDTIGFPSVMGRVTNNTGEDDSLLYVNVFFYNKNAEVIFISGVNVINLHAGETKSFECSTIGIPDNITYEDIANYEVIARKMHYQF